MSLNRKLHRMCGGFIEHSPFWGHARTPLPALCVEQTMYSMGGGGPDPGMQQRWGGG